MCCYILRIRLHRKNCGANPTNILTKLIILRLTVNTLADVECTYNLSKNNAGIIKFLCFNLTVYAKQSYEEKMMEAIYSATDDLAKETNISIEFQNSSLIRLDPWIVNPFIATNLSGKVTHIILEGCNIVNISSDSLSSFKNLGSLNLNNNPIIDYLFFQRLSKLKNIYFSNNKIPDLDDFTKKVTSYGQFSRDSLELKNCSLSSLIISKEKNMYFVYIKTINLSYNDIKSVSNEYYSGVKLSLILRGNSNLKSLGNGIFSTLDLSEYKNNFDLSLLKNVSVSDFLIIQKSKIKILDKSKLDISRVVKPGATLDFSNSAIEYVQGQFFEKTSLKTLNLSLNNFSGGVYSYEFKNSYIETLDFSSSQINEISSSAFCNFTTKKLILSSNKLNILSDMFYESCNTTIYNLDLSNNKIAKLDKIDLQYVKELKTLDLSLNPITVFENYALENLKNITNLILTVSNGNNISSDVLQSDSLLNLTFRNSNITFLNDDNFSGLSKLQELRFENCSVGNMTNSSLAGLFNLKYLDKNILRRPLNVTKLPWDIFKDLYSITKLDLSHIYLYNIDGRSFTGLYNVVNLNLSNNFFSKISSDTFAPLKKLAKLDLSYCYILIPLPSGVFSSQNNLEYLSLKGNPTEDLVTTGVFTNLEKLVTLDLSNNKFRGLDVTALLPLKNIKSLLLDNNRLSLSKFPQFHYKNLTEYLPTLKYIGLSNNTWECNLLSDMLTYFTTKSIKYNPIVPVKNGTNVDGIGCTE